jgi:hypothetical protein
VPPLLGGYRDGGGGPGGQCPDPAGDGQQSS